MTTKARNMASDTDLIKLYSGRILQLAADIPLTDRLATPQASVKKRSPLCGSSVSVDVVMEQGRIKEFGQDVKACALGQASASVLGGVVLGQTEDSLRQARDELRALLKGSGEVPAAPFDGYEVFLPAAAYKNRHASILLAIEATCEAMDEIQAAQTA